MHEYVQTRLGGMFILSFHSFTILNYHWKFVNSYFDFNLIALWPSYRSCGS